MYVVPFDAVSNEEFPEGFDEDVFDFVLCGFRLDGDEGDNIVSISGNGEKTVEGLQIGTLRKKKVWFVMFQLNPYSFKRKGRVQGKSVAGS